MKWRVERPDRYEPQAAMMYPHNGAIPVDPDIVEADIWRVQSGALVFNHKAYAAGQWTTVERVEDE